jgi:excisionase family DNA binding protein
MSEQKYVDIHALCRRYAFCPWTVRTWCSQGRIPFVRAAGRKVLFDVDAIEDWLKQQAVTPKDLSHVVEV